MDFITASVRQRESSIAFADAGEVAGEVCELLCDEVDHLPFRSGSGRTRS